MQTAVRDVEVKPPIARYMLSIVSTTREHADIVLGASPRGALALFRAAQARAYMSGRAYVVPEDVQALVVPALAHRIALTPEARYSGRGAEGILTDIVKSLRVPL